MERELSNQIADLKREMEKLEIENERLKIFCDLGKVLIGERNLDKLLPMIMKEISKSLEADRSTLCLVDWEHMELWTKFSEGVDAEKIKIELKMGLVGLSVLRRELINTRNANQDPRFNSEIDGMTGFRTESLLSAPFFNKAGEVVGAVELLDKKAVFFTKEDEEKLLKTTSTLTEMDCGTDLEYETAKKLICELRQSTDCERGALFLLDREKKELYSLVAEGLEDQEIHLSMNLGIAGLVAVTGQELTIQDAYNDRRFNKSVDEKTGYRTKSILCVPIKNQSGEVLGAFEAINKKTGTFSEYDMEFLLSLSSLIGIAVENAILFDDQDKQFMSVLEVLAASIDAKDQLTAGHSQKVTEYAVGIAQELGLQKSEIDVLAVAALLHDYGKLGINEDILKKPGKLTAEEFEHVKEHVVKTRDILNKMQFMRKYHEVPLIASCHHERLDGSGYSRGLDKAYEIPLLAKIIAVADVFEALTARRHYREALSSQQALKMLQQDAGSKFDANILNALERFWEKGDTQQK